MQRNKTSMQLVGACLSVCLSVCEGGGGGLEIV